MTKTNFVLFIERIENKKDPNTNIFFVFGNNDDAISATTKSVFDFYKKKLKINEKIIVNDKEKERRPLNSYLGSQSLFSENAFVVVENPTEKLIEEIKEIKVDNSILLINGKGLKASSKIKNFFDLHKNYLSISCYEISLENKKKIIDGFFLKKQIKLETDARFYLLENISKEYMILYNELEKISLLEKNMLTIDDIKSVLISSGNHSLEELFFICAEKSSASLLNNLKLLIKSQNDSYEALRYIKRFVGILSEATISKKDSSAEEATNAFLPKYLFLKKNTFKKIVERNNPDKINKIYSLIQKTEIILRKNPSNFFEVTERFLLNFGKLIN